MHSFALSPEKVADPLNAQAQSSEQTPCTSVRLAVGRTRPYAVFVSALLFEVCCQRPRISQKPQRPASYSYWTSAQPHTFCWPIEVRMHWRSELPADHACSARCDPDAHSHLPPARSVKTAHSHICAVARVADHFSHQLKCTHTTPDVLLQYPTSFPPPLVPSMPHCLPSHVKCANHLPDSHQRRARGR